uniref:Ribosomal protein S11 n=1 Tax=Scytosiphon lomentaria TaxID=27967 RepID=A0A0U1V7B8_SCYLO|nr:ribosomal protein S11 [Scytosiphon lomentaria]AIQ78528.1 ribosomal protein S11 [Scytosiphon lomentaria]
MLVQVKSINKYFKGIKKYLFSSNASMSLINKEVLDKERVKKGNIYIKSTGRNIFCTLIGTEDKKVKTSCSLRVPEYNNEFNERENLFKRGILLGELLGDKIINLGYTEVTVHLDFGLNKGRKGVIIGLKKKRIKISLIELSKGYPHNGCRPKKIRRKKLRTKFKS